MSAELCYLSGLLIAAIGAVAMTPSFAKDHGWRTALPLALVVTLGVGIAIGWALSGEFNLISTSRGGSVEQ